MASAWTRNPGLRVTTVKNQGRSFPFFILMPLAWQSTFPLSLSLSAPLPATLFSQLREKISTDKFSSPNCRKMSWWWRLPGEALKSFRAGKVFFTQSALNMEKQANIPGEASRWRTLRRASGGGYCKNVPPTAVNNSYPPFLKKPNHFAIGFCTFSFWEWKGHDPAGKYPAQASLRINSENWNCCCCYCLFARPGPKGSHKGLNKHK